MNHTIDNSQDILDVRDIISRVEELQGEMDAAYEHFNGREPDDEPTYQAWLNDVAGNPDYVGHHLHSEEAQEFLRLQSLLEDLKGYGGDEQWRGDWYPVSLVRDSYFKDYAQELAEDIGAIKDNASWPYTCIDWEQAAQELRTDYSSVEFDGVTYWYR